jgi:hypothetical protein
MKFWITRWNAEPLYDSDLPLLPFSPVQRARKFSAVLGDDVVEQFHRDAAEALVVGGEVEEHAGVTAPRWEIDRVVVVPWGRPSGKRSRFTAGRVLSDRQAARVTQRGAVLSAS